MCRCVRQVMVNELPDLHHVQTVDGTVFVLVEVGNVGLLVDEDAHLASRRQRLGVVANSRRKYT